MKNNFLVILLLLSLIILLSGCAASLTAYPQVSYDPRKELDWMQTYLSSDVIEKYHSSNNADRKGLTQREWRDLVVEVRIRAINLRFNEFQRSLYQEGVVIGIGTDWTTLALNATGALYKSTAQTMSAISAGIIGGKSSFDKNAYFEKSMPTLLAMMSAKRKEVLVNIRKGLVKDIGQYPLDRALDDLDSYYAAGSIPGALLEVANNANAVSQKAQEELKQILEVRPVPEDVQKRKEGAAAFVKSLPDPEKKRLAEALAAALRKSAPSDPLNFILSEIATAQTKQDFDIVAQQIQILFNKEF